MKIRSMYCLFGAGAYNFCIKIVDAVAVTDDLAFHKAIESSGRTVAGTIGILFRGFKLGVLDKGQLISMVDRTFKIVPCI